MKKQKKLSILLESAIKNIVLNELSPKTRASAFSKAFNQRQSSSLNDTENYIRENQAEKFLEIPKKYHQEAQKIVDTIASDYVKGDSDLVSYTLRKNENGNVLFTIKYKYIKDIDRPKSFDLINIFYANIFIDSIGLPWIDAEYTKDKNLPDDIQNIGKSPISRVIRRFLQDLKSEVVPTDINKESKQIKMKTHKLKVTLNEIKRMQELAGVRPLNEGKQLDRDEMMAWIKQYMKTVRTSEEFNGSKGAIWVSGENQDKYKGKVIYDYYSDDTKNRELGVLSTWEKELDKRGWYSEWEDAGTVMIVPA
jgi:2-succinyl-5-enolpyruvyl-6-hydroxy-3-cyclohexene-1-carboxylate synthase